MILSIRHTQLRAIPYALIAFVFQPCTMAQSENPDVLYVSGHFDHLSAGSGSSLGNGGGGGVEWLHLMSPRTSFDVGLISNTLAGTTWTFGKVGASNTFGQNTVAYGEANLGSGRAGDHAFGYRTYRASLSQPVIAKKLFLELEDQYVSISSVKGNLVKVGGTWLPVSRVTLRNYYHFSTSGNVQANMVSERAEVALKRFQLLGGVAIGRTSPVLLNVIQPAEVISRGRANEYFVGVVLPMGQRRELTLMYDTIRAPQVARSALFLNWRLPLPRSFGK